MFKFKTLPSRTLPFTKNYRHYVGRILFVLSMLSAVNAGMNMQKDSKIKHQPPFSIVKIKTYPKYSSFEEASLYTATTTVSKNKRRRLKNDEFFDKLSKQLSFRKLFIRALRKSKYENYFLEFMPIKAQRQSETAVKFMLIKSLKISRKIPSPAPFSQYLNRKSCKRQKYSCIGKFESTTFIIPKNSGNEPLKTFSSLGTFSRAAPRKQKNFMIKMLAKRVKTEIDNKKEGFTYISTGDLLKAPWLHFRIGSTSTSYSCF